MTPYNMANKFRGFFPSSLLLLQQTNQFNLRKR